MSASSRGRRRTIIALMLSCLVVPDQARAGDISGAVDSGGASATLTLHELRSFQAEYTAAAISGSPRWRYRTAIAACDVGGLGASAICYQSAVDACAGNTAAEGRGPLVDVFRLWVDSAGTPLPPPSGDPGATGWVHVGTTCLPELVPGASPAPTMAMVLRAFHTTRWAGAMVQSQPEGNRTLVNLPTFFRVEWQANGYQPGEVDAIDPATMFGYDVEIRPTLRSFVYSFGDGAAFGPTRSSGGTFPDGDIRHTYMRPGTFHSWVAVTFGGEFRINKGEWVTIPDTVTVRQPSTTVSVREAKAVLVE